MNIYELLRKETVTSLFSGATVPKCWEIWKPEINKILGNEPSAESILSLGDNLSNIFSTTGTGERSQSQVSAGGHAWEALVCWYLNICLIGSRTVVIKQNKKLIPSPIRDAITVNYGNFPSNTEADLIALTFPEDPLCDSDIEELRNNLLKEPSLYTKNGDIRLQPALNVITQRLFNKFEVCIIQCKTNWNDNAQIPMLWGMIYSVNEFIDDSKISIGSNNYHAHNLNKFKYAFITVPTNENNPNVKKDLYKPTSTAVKRVSNLSGGNYWGKPKKDSVAESIKDIFGRNFSSGFKNQGIRIDIEKILKNNCIHTDYNYFKLK